MTSMSCRPGPLRRLGKEYVGSVVESSAERDHGGLRVFDPEVVACGDDDPDRVHPVEIVEPDPVFGGAADDGDLEPAVERRELHRLCAVGVHDELDDDFLAGGDLLGERDEDLVTSGRCTAGPLPSITTVRPSSLAVPGATSTT